MPWILMLTPTYRRGYKNLSSDLQRKVERVLREFAVRDPRSLGVGQANGKEFSLTK
ncbi:MAG: hypothetical protein HYY67_00710 [Thaumarchaeota archaeon]|nr:hypothetical protein [Nitrososphaerota archaeon]